MINTTGMMPIATEMRFRFAEYDGAYVDYHWEQDTAGGPIRWQLSHDLEDDTWHATLDCREEHQEATKAQTEALVACLTEGQKMEAAQEAKDHHRGFVH